VMLYAMQLLASTHRHQVAAKTSSGTHLSPTRTIRYL
jgi:hypothetical protein